VPFFSLPEMPGAMDAAPTAPRSVRDKADAIIGGK
jgi:hypothetical protein